MKNINYDKLDEAIKVAQTAPFPQLAINHVLQRIIDAGPPNKKEDEDKLATFLHKMFD